MLVSNVSHVDLVLALAETNKHYEDNVIFNRFECDNAKQTRYRVTLRVKSSRGKGARLGHTGRHLINACWHVHGDFFHHLLALNSNVVIRSGGKIITRDGGNWQDWDIGSGEYPMRYSEACECE